MEKYLTKLDRTDWKYILILALLCIAGYWQISFGVHSLKWDIIDYYFPSRFMLGEIFQSNALPLWNPYQTLGYPIHADPQSGAWYPVAWIIGYLKGYTLNAVGFEFLLHIFIGSWGMFSLAKTLNYNKKVALILAIAYMFSGFFVGNAQHLTWIISGAWLPWVIKQYIVLFEKRTFYNAALLTLWSYLFLSAGYPAFVFVTIYFLLILTVFFTVKEYKSHKIKGIISYYKYLFISLVMLVICSSIVLVSNYFVLPYLTRSEAITPEMALFSPFSPMCSMSFLAPFAVVGHNIMELFKTDLSMTNGYFGIILLVFFIMGAGMKKKNIQWLFLFFAIFSLLASFGEYTPVRMFLYNHIPMMNTFRFPSLFRLFFIFFFILIAGYALQNIFFAQKKLPVKTFLVSGFLITLMIIIILIFRGQDYLNVKIIILNKLFTFSDTSFYKQHFAVHALFQIMFLLAFVFVVWRYKTSSISLLLITILIIVEMFLSTQLNAPYTIYEKLVKTKEAQAYLNTFPKQFPIPNNNPIARNETDVIRHVPFWKNLSMYNKQVSHEGFTPFTFKDFRYLSYNIPHFFDEMLKNPLVYVSGAIHPESDFEELSENNLLDSTLIFMSNADYLLFQDIKPDTSAAEFHITRFSPTTIQIECYAPNKAMLILLQNYYYGWAATINDKNMPIYKANYTVMAVPVEKGKNLITFSYRPKSIIIAYFVSIFSFFILFFYLIIAGLLKSELIKNLTLCAKKK